MYKQGDCLELQISGLTDQGEAIGHHEGLAVFIPDAVPGDRLNVRLMQFKKSYALGQIQAILDPSPERITPRCLIASKCGGCQWQVISDTQQARSKQEIVQAALERLGGLSLPPLAPFMAAPEPLHYRNKVTYPIVPGLDGEPLRLGYYRPKSHRVVNLSHCPVQATALDELLPEIKADLQESGWSAYDEATNRGVLRHLGLRIGRRTGNMLLTLVVRDTDLPHLDTWAEQWLERFPQLVGVCLNLNPRRTNVIFGPETICIAGRPELTEVFAGLEFAIDSTSFFQIYTEQAERLWYWLVQQLDVQPHSTVIDAYCGIGTMGLPLAAQIHKLIGIELWPAAVEKAQANARRNGLTNTEFHCGSVESLLPQLPVADIVLLDPPRKGCDREVLDTLLQQQPRQIGYISCNPATLARDLQILSECYHVQAVQAADLFPQTAHVETAVSLVRR